MNLIGSGWRGLAARFLLARKRRAALTAAGVGLGTALLAAILTLGATLRAAVDDQMRDQFGTWDVMVAAPDLTTATLDPAAATGVAALPEVAYTVPLATRPSGSPDTPVEFYVGLGHFPPHQFGVRLVQGHEAGPGEVVLPVSLAERLGTTLGERVTLPFPDGPEPLTLVGLLRDSGVPPTAYFDYNWLAGRLHLPAPPALLIALRPGATKSAFVARVAAQFPELTLDRREGLDQARSNLNGFGTLGRLLGGGALLTGAFLVLGAFGITVQERVRELAILRALGAQRRQLALLLLQEALLLGGAGAAAGTGLGVLSAWGLAAAAARFLHLPPAHALVLPDGGLAAVAVAAVLLAAAGAWPAAWRAGRTAPLAAMRPDLAGEAHRERAGGLAAAVLLLAACGLAAFSLRPSLAIPAASQLAALAALLLLLALLAALTGLVPLISRVVGGMLGHWRPAEALLAWRNLARQRRRAARAAGVLLLGLTVLLAVASTVQSEFRSKEILLRQQRPTELQVAGPWGSPSGFGDDLLRQLAAIPGVADVVPTGVEVPADLVGYDPNRARPEWLQMQRQNGQPPGRVFLQPVDYAALGRIYPFGPVDGRLGGGIALTRHLAQEMGLYLGETLRLRATGTGTEVALTVTALVEHLPEDQVLTVDAALARPLQAQAQYRVAHLRLAPGADRGAVKAALGATLGRRYAALAYSDVADLLAEQRHRQAEMMAIILAAAAVILIIAGAGLANTVAATLQERRRELAVLQALGATPAQVIRLITLEMVLLGLAGSGLGAATGTLTAVLSALPGLPHGMPLPLPYPLIGAGLAAGPLLAACVARMQMQAARREPLVQALRIE